MQGSIIAPIIDLLVNSFLLSAIVVNNFHESVLYVCLEMLPHGLFECPATLLSIALGFRLFIKMVRGGKLIRLYKETLMVFALIILPLFLIAALAESLEIYISRI